MNTFFLVGAAGACLILAVIIGFVLAYNRLQRLSVKVDEAASGIDVALEKRWDLLNELLAAVKKYLTHEYETLTGVTALRSGTEAEAQRLKQQAEVSAETVRSIDQEIELQSQSMEKIRGQLEAERGRGNSFRSRWEARSQSRSQASSQSSGQASGQSSGQARSQMAQSGLRRADRSRTAAVSQKIEALASLHRDLNSVTAGIDALYEQYPLLNSWISLDQYQRAAFQAEEHLQAARRLYNSNVSLYNQTVRTIPWVLVASLCHMKEARFYEVEESKRNFEGNLD